MTKRSASRALSPQRTKTARAGGPMRSGELAAMAGVSRDALRHYERQGLLPPAQRSANGYRHYPPQALERVRLLRAALGIGFTVDELREIFSARDRGQAPCRRVHELAVEKARGLELQIAELKRLHRSLQSAVRSWSRKLKSTAPDERAGLLEIFVANHPESTRAISPLVSPGLKRKLERNEGRRK
ncbi:MAG TPA: heavy metal-responsive transcriptional regulator [Terriglobales bacterium]|nr:heavy metal-responsive transcriptional regulator [Terriglobales bacterium]